MIRMPASTAENLRTFVAQNIRSHWNGSKDGLIGVEIRARSISIAQLRRDGEDRSLRAHWEIPLSPPRTESPAEFLSQAMEDFRQHWAPLKRMFRGNRVAVTLPHESIPFRILSVPTGSFADMQTEVQQELKQEPNLGSNFAFAAWPIHHGTEGFTEMAAVAVPTSSAHEIVHSLLECGLECQQLDALPSAIARLVATAQAHDSAFTSATPSAILHLGWNSSHLYCYQNERIGFGRALSRCGLKQVYQTIENQWHLNEQESDLLLTEFGFTKDAPNSKSDNYLQRILEPNLNRLHDEIKRTLTYVERQYPTQRPHVLWACGEGSKTLGLTEPLNQRLQIPVQKLPAYCPLGPDNFASSAVAQSLSAIEWEPE